MASILTYQVQELSKKSHYGTHASIISIY